MFQTKQCILDCQEAAWIFELTTTIVHRYTGPRSEDITIASLQSLSLICQAQAAEFLLLVNTNAL